MSDDAAGLYRPMDFVQKTQFFTLDVISALAFGVPFGYLARDEDCLITSGSLRRIFHS